jgi:putative DNA primase/helicase
MFDKKELAEKIIEVQPCFYDKSKSWWLWDWSETKWERVDETDILNAINKQATINTINSKEKNEMIEALKQVSRLNAPTPIGNDVVQFNNTIINISTGKKQRATPKLFVTNPIPYDLDENGFFETPIMDKIFEEWVGKENIQTLYEILAYSLIPNYPIHRIFCFIGGGMNGKSCFLNLLRKFIGQDNCCSTELDTLLQSRFEVTRLHKKLVCQMGETDFSEMNKTSILKKLSGGDLIGFEYKNKDPFEEVNYAKIIIATNNLPATSDKTIGFYRRWMIIDFPNQFSEKKDILADIPEEEYEALAVKCSFILKDLLETRTFTNEGTVEERMERYENHSNPLGKFLKEFTEEDYDGNIWKNDFSKKLNSWCKENRFREISDVHIGKKMKSMNINQSLRNLPWDLTKKGRCWVGIKWKGEEN